MWWGRRRDLNRDHRRYTLLLAALLVGAPSDLARGEDEAIQAERLDPSTYGSAIVETMDEAVARDLAWRANRSNRAQATQDKQLHQSHWVVPSRRATYFPHSGERNLVNKGGGTRMGIGFGQPVDFHGVYVAGQSSRKAWTPGIQVIGFRAGSVIGQTEWFTDINTQPTWMEVNLPGVDRIVILARPAFRGQGWYALDDLTYSVEAEQPATVIDFENVPFNTTLSGTGFAGLIWEVGKGAPLDSTDGIHHPMVPDDYEEGDGGAPYQAATIPGQPTGTLPTLERSFQGVIRGDADSFSFPPDTMGAVGPNHYVETVNRNFAVYDKVSGAELINIHLGAFLPGSAGDPRVLFDQHSGRWIVIVSDFVSQIFLAVSSSGDPTGDWFKSSFVAAQGSDAGTLPDYPTLGVDQRGIYISAYMVGRGMSVFAVAKAPLIAPTQSLGTVTAFRNIGFEGAIQPVHTYGDPGVEYLVSRVSPTQLRLRAIHPPLTAPTLSTAVAIVIPSHARPPDAPALGSIVPLDTVGDRLMMSVFRDGSIWTAHAIGLNGRSACRWYEVDAVATVINQVGTVADPELYYYFPSIMVNRNGHVAMGFTGSSATEYAGAYYTGRRQNDSPGEMAPPVLLQAGSSQQNNIDGFGRNRWGDYSYTTLDPVDEQTIWTIQEYAHDVDTWGTWIASFTFDCNGNGTDDEQDVIDGTSNDCNGNLIPDECEQDEDCNGNGVQDICDIANGTSLDCNDNDIPDGCEPADDCNNNGVQDICDIASGSSTDCNLNSTPDECDLSDGASTDCDRSGLPDECDSAADCNANGVQDICEIADGSSSDCNANGVPDDCDVGGGDAPVADACESARLVCPGFTYSGTTVDATNDGSATCASSAFSPDVWYRYGPQSDGVLEVSLCGSAYDTAISIHTACPGNSKNEVACNDDSCDLQSIVSLQVTAGADYWIRVAGFAGGVGNFTMQLVGPNCRALPADCNGNGVLDECDVATETSADCNDNGIPDECDPQLDCNNNGVQDICDVAASTSDDCNTNEVPDECEPQLDCNNNGAQDICDLATESSPDCNLNEIPDECDVADESSGDCNANIIPDECESQTDCNDNGIQDFCDLALGTSPDCNDNIRPDECDIYRCGEPSGSCPGSGDCCDPNGNGTRGCNCARCCAGVCEIDPFCCDVVWDSFCAFVASIIVECNCGGEGQVFSPDCNDNDVPDECDVASMSSDDCNNNTVPDECDPILDCNTNGVQDICDVAAGTSDDCNANEIPDLCETDCNATGIPDDCDVTNGTSIDCQQDLIPDECQLGQTDCNGNGVPDDCDIGGVNLLLNGAFESGDFSGWTQINSGPGSFLINDGAFNPPSPDPALEPCSGNFGAIASSTGPGQHSLYQDITIPADAGAVTVRWVDRIRNHASQFSDPNQEFRVEVWDTDNNLISEIFSTDPGDVRLAGCVLRSFDLSAFIGETIRLAFTTQDSLFFLNVHIDDVRVLESSDISKDCDEDGIPDECEVPPGGSGSDCNKDSIPDNCQLGSNDCNANLIPDECEPDKDCNENGVLDLCDGTPVFWSSPNLSPIGAETPQTFVIRTPPPAVGEVTLSFVAVADLDLSFSERIVVNLNGQGIGAIFDGSAGHDCPLDPDTDQLTISAATFNNLVALVADGDAQINMVPAVSVQSYQCFPDSYIAVSVQYKTISDCNSNGTLDLCDLAGGFSVDCNVNGLPDDCEPDCDQNGITDDCDPNFDCNGNGVQDICDVARATSPDCNGNNVPDECDTDFDVDGTIDDCDGCPLDPNKVAGGQCGCGALEDDGDLDGVADCNDGCPADPNKIEPGNCGCGRADEGDSDDDNVLDCVDQCRGVDDAIFAPECSVAIPAVSSWGLVILALLLLAGSKVYAGWVRSARRI